MHSKIIGWNPVTFDLKVEDERGGTRFVAPSSVLYQDLLDAAARLVRAFPYTQYDPACYCRETGVRMWRTAFSGWAMQWRDGVVAEFDNQDDAFRAWAEEVDYDFRKWSVGRLG